MSDETTQLAAVDVAMEELEVLIADANHAAQHDTEWLVPWWLRKKAELEAARELVKAQAKRLLAQIDSRERALDYQWGPSVQEHVRADIQAQGGTKKSVDYLTGRAGYRTTGGRVTVVIEDEAAAIAAAETACPEAVKKSILKSIMQAHIAATGEELPGTKLITTPKVESFYPALTYMALTKEGE